MPARRSARRRLAHAAAALSVASVGALALAAGFGPGPTRATGAYAQVCFDPVLSCPTVPPSTDPPTTPPPTDPPTTPPPSIPPTTPPPTTPPTTGPSTTTTTKPPAPGSTTTTVAPAPAPAPPGGKAFFASTPVPCPKSATSSPCAASPTSLSVVYSSGSAPVAVEVDWTAGPPSAPAPRQRSVVLRLADAKACGTGSGVTVSCWAWPSDLMDGPWVLNGTYRVVPCSAITNNKCQTSNALDPVQLTVAAPPAAPTNVQAASTGDTVAVSWSPSANPEPDLVGYAVTRNGKVIYSCTLNGLGPGSATPCPQNLSIVDRPGGGKWSYAVSALRLGADTAASDVVTSPFSAATSAPVAQGGTVIPGGAPALVPIQSFHVTLPPVPGLGNGTFTVSQGNLAPISLSGLPTVGINNLGAGEGGLAPDTAPIQNLSYPGSDDPVLGKASKDLALKVATPGHHKDVAPVAVLAMGIIVLAIAAHFLYLRVELGLAEARIADRKRAQVRPDGV